mgnify:CR=1 FL=1
MGLYDAAQWAVESFGHAELGDPRRSMRLVEMTAAMAAASGLSLPQALGYQQHHLDACYDLLRTAHFVADDILDAYIQATLAKMASLPPKTRFLLCCDTSSLLFPHETVREHMGPISRVGYARGLLVHTVLVRTEEDGRPLGILAMHRWRRELGEHGKKLQRKNRLYQDRESFEWQRALNEAIHWLGDDLAAQCTVVCDREADIIELLNWLDHHRLRYVLRSCHNRTLIGDEKQLRDRVSSNPAMANLTIEVTQRGGRRARRAELTVKFARVTLRAGWRRQGATPTRPVTLTVLLLQEPRPPSGEAPLEWMLLCSERVEEGDTQTLFAQLHRIYTMRWFCEEFHRCWKSEVDVEGSRLQTREGLEKLACIKAALAMRLLELQKWVGEAQASCEEELEELEWKLLWQMTEEGAPPARAPSKEWAYKAIARLAGWSDSKRTGRAGPKTLQLGLERLETLLLGANALASLSSDLSQSSVVSDDSTFH